MKPLHTRLQEARKRLKIPWEVLERDYLLSWVLAGISRTDILRDTLVFKGGTCLKKCYFGDYRFSEDLDFSGIGDVPKGDAMEAAVRQACETARKLLDEFAPVEIACERYTEKEPHPGGQEAFSIRARFPWHRDLHTRVIIETAVDEKVLKPTEHRRVIHEYGEPFDTTVTTYALEEIMAEKLRAILQHMEKLESRGWGRSRARDYYDLWRVLRTYKDRMKFDGFVDFLHAKCALKNVSFTDDGDFFRENMMKHVEKTWEQWLGPLVPDLPPFQTVIGELRPEIKELLSK